MPSLFPQPGPDLPPFKTLLVKGKYHPSAPIHLSMSYLSGSVHSQAIIITPSRPKLALALEGYGDDWLERYKTVPSSRVKLFYPPSPAHLGLLISMFRAPEPSEDTNGPWLHPKTTLAIAPALLVLHELSMYFLPEGDAGQNSKWTISSYLSLITHALSFSSRSSSGTAFALFDSRLDSLKLPMLKQIAPLQGDVGDNFTTPEPEPVSVYAEKYFEWIVVMDEEHTHDRGKEKSMMLYWANKPGVPMKSWRWKEFGPGIDEHQEGTQPHLDL